MNGFIVEADDIDRRGFKRGTYKIIFATEFEARQVAAASGGTFKGWGSLPVANFGEADRIEGVRAALQRKDNEHEPD